MKRNQGWKNPANEEKKRIKRLVDRLLDYESNFLNEEEEVALFQEIINSGLVWQLQGSYGRVARTLIKKGLCYENKTGSV